MFGRHLGENEIKGGIAGISRYPDSVNWGENKLSNDEADDSYS